MQLLNKKGQTELVFMLLGLIAFVIIALISVSSVENKIELVGETSINAISAFEASERLYYYLDSSVELAAKSAISDVYGNAGVVSQVYKGRVEGSRCGSLVYPFFNNGTNVSLCFPKSEFVLGNNFKSEFSKLLAKYEPVKLDASNFEIYQTSKEAGVSIKVVALNDIEIPVYTFPESYYAMEDKTASGTDPVLGTYALNEDGYYEAFGLTSFERKAGKVERIIIHDSFTYNVGELYQELSSGYRNFNYVIERDGKIFLFSPEDKRTSASDCSKELNNKCKLESVDDSAINVALISCNHWEEDCETNLCYIGLGNVPNVEMCWDQYTDAQLASMKKLIADVASRNPDFEISSISVLGVKDVDGYQSDPSPHFSDKKPGIILDALKLLEEKGTVKKEPTQSPTGNVAGLPSGLENARPTFTNIKTTAYFTTSIDDKPSQTWYSGSGSCGAPLYYCCKPFNERGFFEEVKCQGSGWAYGNVYHTSTIKQTREASKPLEGYTNGKTSTGLDPVAKRTVAVNPVKGTPCYIPYGTKMYIYWGEGNPWNGYYVAEDTGGAFKGACKMDIYAGVGKAAVDEATKYVSGKYPKIYVLDDSFELPDPDFSTSPSYVPSVSGTYRISYSHEVFIPGVNKLFSGTQGFVEDVVDCSVATDKPACVADALSKSQQKFGIDVSTSCSVPDDDLFVEDVKGIVSGLASCSSSLQEACVCNISYSGDNRTFNFSSNRMSPDIIDDYYDKLPFEFVVPSSGYFEINAVNGGVLNFVKDAEGKFLYDAAYSGQLDVCVPEETTYLLCSEIPSAEGQLRFALRI